MISKSDILAIDVVILPPEPIKKLAITCSKKLRATSPITLGATDYRPHTSVQMGYIAKHDIDTTKQIVTKILQELGPITVRIHGAIWSPAKFNGYQFYSLSIEPNTSLTTLNKLLVEKIPTVEVSEPSGKLFVQEGNPDIVPDVFNYIANFAGKHSGENYWPHITLGAGPEGILSDADIPSDLEREFTVDKLSLFQLGNYCTCRRLLGET